MDQLYNEFVDKLVKLYGKYDEEQRRFEDASNAKISRELGYSDAQFSRLINESATDGEYKRVIQNLDRILRLKQLENRVSSETHAGSWLVSRGWFFVSAVLVIILLLTWFYFPRTGAGPAAGANEVPRDDMLRWTFETSFVNPYIKLDDLPEDCNYPCYKYQGNWKLKEGYKIPFFRERSGFHYVAVEVNMYARCISEEDASGELLEGYEYQKHEIWYDQRELPIDTFLNDDSSLKDFYTNMDFNEVSEFVKVATVHTFFRNEFRIDSAIIRRTGKVIGRDLEFVPSEELDPILSKEIQRDIQGELNRIATNRLEDFSRPVSCGDSVVPQSDFNLVMEGDEMSFSCKLTTSRFALDYTKTFVLEEQYIKNVCH